jgi:hypothetical protein
MKKESTNIKSEEEHYNDKEKVKLKPYMWEPMKLFDELAVKLATCMLLCEIYGEDVNLKELIEKDNLRFNK